MYGLRIVDETYWRNNWSAQLGEQLNILNSTYNLLVFGEGTKRSEILTAIKDVPRAAYELVKIHPTTSGNCELWTDNGQCYARD